MKADIEFQDLRRTTHLSTTYFFQCFGASIADGAEKKGDEFSLVMSADFALIWHCYSASLNTNRFLPRLSFESQRQIRYIHSLYSFYFVFDLGNV